jgi:hypothetical protein
MIETLKRLLIWRRIHKSMQESGNWKLEKVEYL